LIMTKTDLVNPNDLSAEKQAAIEKITSNGEIILLPMSSITEEGVKDVTTAACEALLQHRSHYKLKTAKMDEISNRMHLAMPVPRDKVDRPPCIPETLKMNKKDIAKKRMAEWELQQTLYYEMDDEYTGINSKDRYLLDNPDWRYDKVPEIMDGKNIFDYWAPQEIEEKMDQLEREELIRLREYQNEIEELELLNMKYELSDELKDKLARIKKKRDKLMLEKNWKKNTRFTPLARDTRAYQGPPRTINNFERHLEDLGYDSSLAVQGALERGEEKEKRERSLSRSQSRVRSGTPDRSRSESRPGRKRTRDEYQRSLTPKPGQGFKDLPQKLRALSKERDSLKRLRQDGRRGEADRHHYDLKPKHLFSGKMGFQRDHR